MFPKSTQNTEIDKMQRGIERNTTCCYCTYVHIFINPNIKLYL